MEERDERLRRWGLIGKKRGASAWLLASPLLILIPAFAAYGNWLLAGGLLAGYVGLSLLIWREFRAYPK
jgi:hypothetical protein